MNNILILYVLIKPTAGSSECLCTSFLSEVIFVSVNTFMNCVKETV